MTAERIQELWERVIAEPRVLGEYSDHGPRHWRQVEENGIMLAGHYEADVTVVRLFAMFHDSKRENEDKDPDHGRRGAAFATEVLAADEISPRQWSALIYACRFHDCGLVSEDKTIGCCWDADRLDLPRVGITPDPELMSTARGRMVAFEMDE